MRSFVRVRRRPEAQRTLVVRPTAVGTVAQTGRDVGGAARAMGVLPIGSIALVLVVLGICRELGGVGKDAGADVT